MKKIDLFILILIFITVSLVAVLVYNIIDSNFDNPAGEIIYVTKPPLAKTAANSETEKKFLIYSGGTLVGSFDYYDDAYKALEGLNGMDIKINGSENNYPPYNVFTSVHEYKEFENMLDAMAHAKQNSGSSVYDLKNNALVWENRQDLPASRKIDGVETIYQLPELNRGCEVTSLAMLINYLGRPADKMTLADEITKDNTKPHYKGGKLYRGNPNVGFVGDMAGLYTYGLGVYHGPIYELLTNYFETAIDLTGVDFDVLYYYIIRERPVWVITNATFNWLDESNFETWNTESGEIKITYKEHSVLITGYDEDYIYFSDPLSGAVKAPKAGFIKAWEQMGRQAVTVLP